MCVTRQEVNSIVKDSLWLRYGRRVRPRRNQNSIAQGDAMRYLYVHSLHGRGGIAETVSETFSMRFAAVTTYRAGKASCVVS